MSYDDQAKTGLSYGDLTSSDWLFNRIPTVIRIYAIETMFTLVDKPLLPGKFFWPKINTYGDISVDG
jgi:hypothetical protein